MEGKKTELMVGSFCLLAIVVLIAGIVFLKEFKFNRDRYSITVRFDNVAGLKEGDPVMVAGVRKGFVKTISLQRTDVLIDLVLDSDVQLSDDSEFMIMSGGLVGLKYVEIRPGQSERPLDISQAVLGVHQTDVFEVIGMLGDLIADIHRLVEKIDHSVADRGLLGSVERSMADARELLGMIRSLVEENRADVTSVLRDFKATSRELRGLVEDNRSVVDSTVMRFSMSSERFDTVLLQLEEISLTFKAIGEKIDRGEGTLGELVNSRDLHDELQETTREINLLIEDIKKNPRKYFSISVFDF